MVSQAMYTGASALTNHQRNLDVIGNNIANINNNGFKASRVDFRDGLYRAMINPADNSPALNLQSGLGLHISQLQANFLQGALAETGDPMDLALEGDGFFVYQSSAGELRYSRVGAMRISNEEDGMWLVSPQGHYLLDENNNRIRFQGLPSQLSVTADGTLYFGGEGQGFAPVRLQIVDFSNKQGLSSNGAYFTETENSGLRALSNATVLQHYEERSNVDLAEQTTRMIRAQRAFQFASRIVSVADQMAGLCNTIRS